MSIKYIVRMANDPRFMQMFKCCYAGKETDRDEAYLFEFEEV